MKKSLHFFLFFILIEIFTSTSFAAHIKNNDNVFIAILDIDNNEEICLARTLSLGEFYNLLETGGEVALQEQFPHAAFALLYFDHEKNRLFYTTPEEVLANIKKPTKSPSYFNPSLFTVLEKANRALIESGHFYILLTLWTTNNILIPGGIRLYRGTKEIGAWFIEKIRTKQQQSSVEA